MRKFGPKTKDHPTIGRECPACGKPFKEGDYTTLISLGPGDNKDARKRRDEGEAYNAIAMEIHWECSQKEEDASSLVEA